MISKEVKDLRARWRTSDGRALAVLVARWLVGDGGAPPDGVGQIDGRIDLRGFVFPDGPRFPKFEHVNWRNIDFSGSVIRSARLFESTIEECRFDAADLFDWRLWGCRVVSSSFRAAELTGAAIGTGPYGEAGINVWTGVSFDRADLSAAIVSECIFTDCSFRKAKLTRVWFTHVTFDGAVFEGTLRGVKFAAHWLEGKRDPGPMRNVDFRGVRFRDADIRYRFDNVLFDETGDIIVIKDYRSVLERALELARGSLCPEESAQVSLLETLAKHAGDYDSILVPGDFKGLGLELHESALVRLVRRANKRPRHT
jgi:uncharacterized protein YjbI with pentapeptide repeats